MCSIDNVYKLFKLEGKVKKYLYMSVAAFLLHTLGTNAGTCPFLNAGDMTTIINEKVWQDNEGNSWKLKGRVTVNGKEATIGHGTEIVTAGGGRASSERSDAANTCKYNNAGNIHHQTVQDLNGTIDQLNIEQIGAKCPFLNAGDMTTIINEKVWRDNKGNRWALKGRVSVNGKEATIGHGTEIVTAGGGRASSERSDAAKTCNYNNVGNIHHQTVQDLNGSITKLELELR